MKDLFETPELIPTEIQAVLDTIDQDADPYIELAKIAREIEPLGYTFDFYLDAEPFGLRPVDMDLQELEGYEDV